MRKLPLYGLLAEFTTPEDLLAAARKAYEHGYRRMDAYTPSPVEGLADALGFRHTRVPLVVLIGGLTGCIGGFYLQYWIAVKDYPVNVGGRPLNSWLAFIPVTFEMTILFAAFAALFGMLAMNGLPMPYHPVFNTPRFAFASRDRFFLCIEARDRNFELAKTREFLEGLAAGRVCEVPR